MSSRPDDLDVQTRARKILERHRPAIDAALASYLPAAEEAPVKVHESMRYSTLSGGKRFRPAICLLTAEALSAPLEAAMPSACALEMIHAFSLVHDDLPAMDDDDLRRGQPTNHKVFGEAIAILAGDALSALAFEVVARHTPDPGQVRELVAVLGRAVGTRGMIGGQVLDMEGEGRDPEIERVRAIHERKTGALIVAACEMAAIAADASPQTRIAVTGYGERLGMAFQVMDDLLDELASEDFLGKKTGADAARGKMTWPAAVGIERAREDLDRLVEEAVALIRPLDARGELEVLARFLRARVP